MSDAHLHSDVQARDAGPSSSHRLRGQWMRVVRFRWIDGEGAQGKRAWDEWCGRSVWLWHWSHDWNGR
jgi:hypothetical protein